MIFLSGHRQLEIRTRRYGRIGNECAKNGILFSGSHLTRAGFHFDKYFVWDTIKIINYGLEIFFVFFFPHVVQFWEFLHQLEAYSSVIIFPWIWNDILEEKESAFNRGIINSVRIRQFVGKCKSSWRSYENTCDFIVWRRYCIIIRCRVKALWK